jgi:hypothetical protein
MVRKRQPVLHADGTVCREGTRRVPRAFRACCSAFDHRTLACVFDVRYEWWPRQKSWFVPIHDTAGGGGIAIAFCPHCGAKLKGSSKEGRWLEV